MLVSAIVAALQSGRLTLPNTRNPEILRKVPEALTLENELKDYRVEVSETTGRETYNARSGRHDDLVLAAAMAVWLGSHRRFSFDRTVSRDDSEIRPPVTAEDRAVEAAREAERKILEAEENARQEREERDWCHPFNPDNSGAWTPI